LNGFLQVGREKPPALGLFTYMSYNIGGFVMTGIAYAADSAVGSGMAGGLGGMAQFLPLVLIFVVFYFLLIRPQQKQAKQHQAFLNELKKGTKVFTKGGLHGVITGLADNIVSLEIAKDVIVKVSRDAIGGALTKEGAVPAKNEAKSVGG
jgi:preprotein translocase subunit YajC